MGQGDFTSGTGLRFIDVKHILLNVFIFETPFCKANKFADGWSPESTAIIEHPVERPSPNSDQSGEGRY